MTPRRAQSAAKWILVAAVSSGLLLAAAFVALRFMRPLVTVTEAVEGPVVQAFYSTGTIEPEREYPIRSNIAGVVTAVHVDKGDSVTKGQPLAVVSEPMLEFEARRAQAELDERLKRADPESSPVLAEFDARIEAASELEEIARREQKRLESLMAGDAASQVDLDRALERLREVAGQAESLRAAKAAKQLELEKDLAVARAALATATWNLEQQTLRSPIDGVVLDRPVSIGTRMAINDPLMRVADVRPETLVMRAAVDEEDITRVRADQVVRMTLYSFPGQVFEGRVARIYDQADQARRTFEVDVRLKAPSERLAPGMTGELAFVVDTRDKAVVVPAQAVQDGHVWLVRGGHLVRATPTIGIRSVERAEVLSEIKPGDVVVVSPIGTMADGQSVRTTRLEPIAAAGLNKQEITEKPFGAFD